MSRLAPCPSCSRHVRVSDAACPFCGAAVAVAPADSPGAPGVRGRLSRAALFAAGAMLLGASACTDSKCAHLTCGAGVAGTSGGGAGGSGGSGGAAANDGGTDATDGPVAIYSAVFPPPETAKSGTAVARAKNGGRPARS